MPWAVAAAVIIAFVGMFAVLASQPRVPLPRVGDHWHARLSIEVCGQTLPPLPPTPGDVHTHGDGIIHIHPSRRDTEGRNADLGAFFTPTPIRLTASSISVPGGTTYKNGDKCPDGRAGTLQMLVQHRGEKNFTPVNLEYVPADGDTVRVVYGP
jgi:hypothetical protein